MVSKAYAKVPRLRREGAKYNIFGILIKIDISGQNGWAPLSAVIFDPQHYFVVQWKEV